MNDLVYLVAILLFSFVLGLIKYGSLADQYKGKIWQSKFNESWNDFVNFLISGLIGYYFILIKWPILQKGGSFNTGDFVLFIIFAMGMFGHLCVLSKNITDGVEEILKGIKNKIVG